MPRRHLSVPEVAQLVTLVQEGYRYREVGDRLGISSSVVSRAFVGTNNGCRYLETAGYERRAGQGRHRVTGLIGTIGQSFNVYVKNLLFQLTLSLRIFQTVDSSNNNEGDRETYPDQRLVIVFAKLDCEPEMLLGGPMLTLAHCRARLAYAH